MIVRDEEEVLARCLACAKKFADRIIVVDTGSKDKTVQIARAFTDDVYFFEWCDDFSAARNFSFEKADGDLVMWLDADDVISDESCAKINELKASASFDVAFLKYSSCGGSFVYYRERIFRRSLGLKWQGAVHEAISPVGTIVYSDAEICHEKVKQNAPLRNLSIYQKQIARGICLGEREKFYYGRELFFNKMYRESIAVLNNFLCGNGWAENKKEACVTVYRAYNALGEEQNALTALLGALAYGAPGSEVCCELGYHFMQRGDLKSSVFWYKSALSSPEKAEDGGFVNTDCKAFIPYIQLCVLYDRLGDYQTACRYNELAGGVKPNDENYLANKKYFETRKHF